MLNNNKLNLSADSVVNDVKICSFVAVVGLDNFRVQIGERRLNEEAYEEYRDIVSDNRKAFEDLVYGVKNTVKEMAEIEAACAQYDSEEASRESEPPAEETDA